MKLFNTQQKFNGACRRLTTSYKEQATLIHAIGCSAIALCKEEGNPNVDRFRQLLLAMPNGKRRSYVRKWAMKFAPVAITFKDDDIQCKMLRGKRKADHPGWDLDSAMAIDPFELAEESGDKPDKPTYTVDSLKTTVKRSMSRAMKESGASEDEIRGALLELADQAGDIKVELGQRAA